MNHPVCHLNYTKVLCWDPGGDSIDTKHINLQMHTHTDTITHTHTHTHTQSHTHTHTITHNDIDKHTSSTSALLFPPVEGAFLCFCWEAGIDIRLNSLRRFKLCSGYPPDSSSEADIGREFLCKQDIYTRLIQDITKHCTTTTRHYARNTCHCTTNTGKYARHISYCITIILIDSSNQKLTSVSFQ